MSGSSGSWWEDPRTDWSAGDPARAVDLLSRAYPDEPAIRAFAGSVAVDWRAESPAPPARDLWTRLLTETVRQSRVFDLIADVMHDPDSEAFRSLLRDLLGDRLGVVNARLAVRHGLPPEPTDGPDPVVTSLVDTPTEPGDEPVGGLEAITSVTAGLYEPRTQVQALLDAMRRTAMIEIAGQPRGTGFLVGPDLLLTAAHVVDSRRWPPVPLPEVTARFDFDGIAGRSLAETGVAVPVAEFVMASLPTDAERVGRVIDWNAPADHLDFALLRLGFPVPLARDPTADQGALAPNGRGTYPLDKGVYDFERSPLLFILQHPLGQTQKVTWIRTPPTCNASATRIRYQGNTLNGSSGSPVVDIRGRLVALHHYFQDGNNQGVPISSIARAIHETPCAAELFPAAGQPISPARSIDLDPLTTTSVKGRPLVNRGNLRDRIRVMTGRGSANRILVITGESGSGVSYSYTFLSHVAENAKLSAALRSSAPDGLVALQINLSNYIGLGVDTRLERIIGDLLVGLGLRLPTDPLAQDARTLSTLQVWITTTLRNSSRQWWIFFDNVNDLVAVRQGGLDELIHVLFTVADDPQVPLRVVLAGREAERFAQEHSSWLEFDTAIGLVRSEVESWFRARAREERAALDEPRLTAELDRLFPVGGPLPEPRRLAPKLPTLLLDVLGAGHGS